MGREGSSKKSVRGKKDKRRRDSEVEAHEETSSRQSPKKRTGERDSKSHRTHKSDKKKSSSHHKKRPRSASQRDSGSGDERRSRRRERKSGQTGECLTAEHSISRSVSPVRQQDPDGQTGAYASETAVPSLESSAEDRGPVLEPVECPLPADAQRQNADTVSAVEGTQSPPAPVPTEKEEGGEGVQDEVCREAGAFSSAETAEHVEDNHGGASFDVGVTEGSPKERKSPVSSPEDVKPGDQRDCRERVGETREVPRRVRPGGETGRQVKQHLPSSSSHAVSLSRDIRVMNYRDRLAESWRRFRRLQSTRIGFVTLDAPRTVLVWWAQQQKFVEKASQILAVPAFRESPGTGTAATNHIVVKTGGECQNMAEHRGPPETRQEEVKEEQGGEDSMKKDDASADSFADEQEVWSQARQLIKGDDNAVMEEALQIMCSDAAGRKVEILAVSGLRLFPKFGGRPSGVSGQRMCEKIVKYVRRHDNACLHYHLLCPFFAEDSDAQENVSGEVVEPFDEDWVLTQAAIESDAEVAYEEDMDSPLQERECSPLLLKEGSRDVVQSECQSEGAGIAGEQAGDSQRANDRLTGRSAAGKDPPHVKTELENSAPSGEVEKEQEHKEKERSQKGGVYEKEERGSEKDDDSDVEGAATAADDDMHSVEEGTEEGSGAEKVLEGEPEMKDEDSHPEDDGRGEGTSGSEAEEEQGTEKGEADGHPGAAESGRLVGSDEAKEDKEEGANEGQEVSKVTELNREETEGESCRRLRPDKDRHSRWPPFRGNWSKRQADQIRGGGVGLLLDSTHRGYVRRWKAVNSRLMWCLLHVPSASTALLDPLLRKINRLWIVVACAPDEEQGEPAVAEPLGRNLKKEEKVKGEREAEDTRDVGEGTADAEEKEEAEEQQEETHDNGDCDEPSENTKLREVRRKTFREKQKGDERAGSTSEHGEEEGISHRAPKRRRGRKGILSGPGGMEDQVEDSAQDSDSSSAPAEDEDEQDREASGEDKEEVSEEDKVEESEVDKEEESDVDKEEDSEADKGEEHDEDKDEDSEGDKEDRSSEDEDEESEVDDEVEEGGQEKEAEQRENGEGTEEERDENENSGRRREAEGTRGAIGSKEHKTKRELFSQTEAATNASPAASAESTKSVSKPVSAAAKLLSGDPVDPKYAAFLHSLESILYKMRSNDSLLLLGDLKAPIDHPERCPDMAELRRAFPGVLGPYFCPPVLSNEKMEAVRARRRGRRTFPPVIGADGTVDTKLPEHKLERSAVSPRSIALLKLFSKFNLLITNTAREYPCPDDYATLRGLGAAGPGLPEFIMRSLIVVRQRDRVHLHGTSVCTSAKRVHCIHRQVVATLRIRCNSLGTFHYYCPKQLTSVQQQKMNERHRRKMRTERAQTCIVGPHPVMSAPQPMLLVHRPTGPPGNLVLAAAPPPPVQPAPAVLLYNSPRPPPGQPRLVATRPGFIPAPPGAPPPPATTVLGRQPPPPPTAQQSPPLYAVSQPAPPSGVIYVQTAAGPVLPAAQQPPAVVWVANGVQKPSAQIGICQAEGVGVFPASVERRSPPRRVVMLSDAPKAPPQHSSGRPQEYAPPQRSIFHPQERPLPPESNSHPQERERGGALHDRRPVGNWEIERSGIPSTGSGYQQRTACGDTAAHANNEFRERWRPVEEGGRIADGMHRERVGEGQWLGGREQATETRWRDQRWGTSDAFVENYRHDPEGPRPRGNYYVDPSASSDARSGYRGDREDQGYTRMQDTRGDYYGPHDESQRGPPFEKPGRPPLGFTRDGSFPAETDGAWRGRDGMYPGRDPPSSSRPYEEYGSGVNAESGGRLQGTGRGGWSCNRGLYGPDGDTVPEGQGERRHQADQRWYPGDYYQRGECAAKGERPSRGGGGSGGMQGEGCVMRFDAGGNGTRFDPGRGGARFGEGGDSARFDAGCGMRFDSGGAGTRFDGGGGGTRFDTAGIDMHFEGGSGATRFDGGRGGGGRFDGGDGGGRFDGGDCGGRYGPDAGGSRFGPGDGGRGRSDAQGGGARFDREREYSYHQGGVDGWSSSRSYADCGGYVNREGGDTASCRDRHQGAHDGYGNPFQAGSFYGRGTTDMTSREVARGGYAGGLQGERLSDGSWPTRQAESWENRRSNQQEVEGNWCPSGPQERWGQRNSPTWSSYNEANCSEGPERQGRCNENWPSQGTPYSNADGQQLDKYPDRYGGGGQGDGSAVAKTWMYDSWPGAGGYGGRVDA
ncbi:putative uncharacterized protein LOC106064751 [Cystoisospora suis]|uniref:Uncharacterized protein n=1 Tax=Cystoisospora suis TaxID=483139 RepID=A0A2C6KS31_9APIC|nr:putative uncharacterized protein LOC106064751 [Cystoisospora suis]